jgi:hypothetical protein
VTGFAVFSVALPRFFGLAWREQLLPANANLAFGCHGRTIENRILALAFGF